MQLSSDPFEALLLRRAFIGIGSFLVLLLLLTLVAMLAFPSGQPALGPVLALRCLELVLLLAAVLWAVKSPSIPGWVAPTALALNCLIALSIVAGSGGHRALSAGLFLLDGTQFLLSFGFFIRRQWITVVSGLSLMVGAFVLFFVMPASTFPQQMSPTELEVGFLFLLFFGLAVVTGFVAVNNLVSQRIADRARQVAGQLRVAAFHDSATGLPNGLQLEQDLKDWEAQGGPERTQVGEALVLAGFRLDGLEELNENFGVEVTTQVVVEVVREYAQELHDLGRGNSDMGRPEAFRDLYRVESNLFLFALALSPGTQPSVPRRGALGEVIERVAARSPFELRLTFQGGFTFFPQDASTLRQLLRNLLNQLHSRRTEALGQFVPFNHDLYREYLRRESLRSALGTSLEAGDFRLVFQPKVVTASGRLSGFEALARWTQAELGAISPTEFIPLAEQTGQIAELTLKLLDQAFGFLQEMGDAPVKVSVNLSPGVFIPEFLDRVLERLNANGFGSRFDIEITEGVLMRLSGPLHDRFSRLKALGVSFSIDDFGTGYSNLGYLQTLEADVLKIDKRFIDGIPHALKNAKLVTAIIQMAHSLGMQVVAEGVEYREQRDFLAEAGCDQIQGYLYSRPLESAAALAYLKDNGTGA